MSHIVHHFLPFLAWVIFCLIGIASILYIYWTIDDIHANYTTNKEILSILKNPVSCDSLPYGVQDKIEQMSHTLSDDTTCSPNK